MTILGRFITGELIMDGPLSFRYMYVPKLTAQQ